MALDKLSKFVSVFLLLLTGPRAVSNYIPVENVDIHDLLEKMKSDLTSVKTSTDNMKNIPSEMQKLVTKNDQQISEVKSKIDQHMLNLKSQIDQQMYKMESKINGLHGCPDGWHKGKYNCYFMPFWKTSWTNAERYCNRFGAHLVSLETNSETSDVTNYLTSLTSDKRYHSTNYVWLGGFDFYTEGTWRWVTGAKISSSNWNPGRPGTSTSYNCMMSLDQSRNHRWHDYPCEYDKNFLCEKEFD